MSIYNKFKAKQFKILTIINCFIADISIVYYIYEKMGNKEEFMRSMDMTMKLMKQVNPSANNQLYPGFEKELWMVFIKTLISLLVFYIALHSIIYIFHYLNKKFAAGYVKFYSWSAGVLMMIFGVTQVPGSNSLFIIPAALLLFNAFGFKNFKTSEQ